MWEVALASARERPGLLTAAALATVTPDDIAALFRIDDETVADPERRAALWRDLAAGLERDHDGQAAELLAAAGGCLGGGGGLVALLGRYEAYSDPLRKKAFLFAKICERRGWLQVADPEGWEVSADNVLMRLALRAGLVDPGPAQTVRAGTRDAFHRVGLEAGVDLPMLDDLLWELGRRDPDLLGTAGGAELREPDRPEGTIYY